MEDNINIIYDCGSNNESVKCFICKKELVDDSPIKCHHRCIKLVAQIKELEDILSRYTCELDELINNSK
jgi:hypothetical protein